MLGSKTSKMRVLLAATAIVLLAGCGSYGPRSMDRDQIDYGRSVGNNWKNQMLDNIVKIRFMDMPVFVDVGSIVSGYSVSTTVNGALGWNNSFLGENTQGLGASGTYTDRPTITYMPKTGDDYLKAILEPVQPTSLLALIQAGYSAELLFTWAVEAINGIHNWAVAANKSGDAASPEFLEYVALLEDLQRVGAVGFELEKDKKTNRDMILVLRKKDMPESVLQKSDRAREIIGLAPGLDRYRVIYAPFKIDSETLAIQTRSVIQMLSAMSRFVDVPAEKSAHAVPGFDLSGTQSRPFRVHSSPDQPEDSFAAIKYEDYWYWIENADIASKRVFTLMLFITTLTNQATDEQAPVLTIPTQ
jgi:hypothetical protein